MNAEELQAEIDLANQNLSGLDNHPALAEYERKIIAIHAAALAALRG